MSMLPHPSIGVQQTSTSAEIPASYGGINATSALSSMRLDQSVYSFNMGAKDRGVVVRPGNVEYANGWTGNAAKTVISFEGNTAADAKLWVANELGIWDVTTDGETSPTKVATFGSASGEAGVCSYVAFTNDGNARFILLCDGENGYWLWTESTDTWALQVITTNITGIDPDNFNYVMVWKKRVWFVEKESANAWYLATGTYNGTVTKFNFGDQLTHGGVLTSMHNWTIDGGQGVDDYFAAIGSGGDIAVYQGTDPAAAATFALIGTWYLGGVPYGNRIGYEFSGELFVLSVQGLLPMSRLLQGSSVNAPETYITAPVAPYFRAVMQTESAVFGWGIHVHPKQSSLIVSAPPVASEEQLGFNMYMGNMSWSMDRGLDVFDKANWKGDVFWSSRDANVLWKESGAVDKVYLDPSTDGLSEPIVWAALNAYTNLEQPARLKKVSYIRPLFSSSATPGYAVKARYDYDISEVVELPSLTSGTPGLWDTGVWGVDIWGGSSGSITKTLGASGMGYSVAVAIRGESVQPVTLVGYHVTFEPGGFM